MPAVKECMQTTSFKQHPDAAVALPAIPRRLDIIDIRSNKVDFNLKDEIASAFNSSDSGARKLPALLLYDERGLQLFEDITYLDEYYLTNYEIELLKKHSVEIAAKIPEGAMLIELGSGNLRKVCLLLQAFEDARKSINYYALDLSQTELERTLSHVPDFKHVSCHGLLGTYDDGVAWLKQPALVAVPKCILHLGSSIVVVGNFHRDEAAEFLQSYADILKPTDSMLVGLDSCGNPDKIYHAYNDSQGITHEFILNGLANANHIYNQEVFHVTDWKVIGEYVFDDQGGRHQAFLSPVKEVTVLGSVIKPHERVFIEQSLKYSKIGAENLWTHAGLRKVGSWTKDDEYVPGLHMLKRSYLPLSKVPSVYAASNLPSLADWHSLWSAWDIVTKGMLPKQELTEKPIKLRNACIFYLGHIPTFLDIQLTKTTGRPPTHPASYYGIFERGIDPDVDNPEKCHDHSVIPDEWPPVEEIEAYQGRVRARLTEMYEKEGQGPKNIPRSIARAIWAGFEHEVMHIETLLYMMLQSDKTLPPPHTGVPNFERMAKTAFEARVPNQWFDVPAQTITIGMDDPEDGADDVPFGWDNEKPKRKVKVHAFQAKGRPITNEEYAQYMFATQISQMPASWVSATTNSTGKHMPTNLPESFLQGKSVRTMYGLVPLKYALDWPVMASYNELAGCACWIGGRIPTFEEAQSIYAFVESARGVEVSGSTLVKKVPAVNGYVMTCSPSLFSFVSYSLVKNFPSQADLSATCPEPPLFVDLAGANVGFKHWHPTPVTSQGGSLGGRCGTGGVWEWTSSPLRRHDGFQPMALYPQYTADFFDEKHNVVLGGSWATHPRIAGRRTFMNWYQRSYPFAWVGARLVRDVGEQV
ncbi:hypothetical protein UVI_02056430 [Ustilaginoidea virens]|uniref:DUF323 domain protein n=1 Tax=Ustilaginoidea virens TaxID=1159556 RepID=A0A1B5L634_USTVR|nr:hypothetical protein UVI_02056430 [Ustilaginoidea virens]